MPADRAAFRKLVSEHTIPKTRVTCVTRVTANKISDLAGHIADAERVTCVTEAPLEAVSLPPRDRFKQECVTRKNNNKQTLTYLGHAVTRSRTESGREKKGLFCGAPQAAVLIDWLSYYEERAAIREYEGGLDRAEAEGLALNEAVAALGPVPRDLPAKSSECRLDMQASGLKASAFPYKA
ncbi:MAG: hypothetical protein MIL41_09520 [Hyphomicrobiales bacterium]|jgi:hypothetical protein